MRWVYLAIVVVFLAAIVISVVQNRGALVTMSFLDFGVRAPLAILAVVVYLLGTLTGGSLYALLRKSVSESQLTGAR